jgi:hypothetical protein
MAARRQTFRLAPASLSLKLWHSASRSIRAIRIHVSLKGGEWIEILDMTTTLSLPFRHELIAETVLRRTRSLPGADI